MQSKISIYLLSFMVLVVLFLSTNYAKKSKSNDSNLATLKKKN